MTLGECAGLASGFDLQTRGNSTNHYQGSKLGAMDLETVAAPAGRAGNALAGGALWLRERLATRRGSVQATRTVGLSLVCDVHSYRRQSSAGVTFRLDVCI